VLRYAWHLVWLARPAFSTRENSTLSVSRYHPAMAELLIRHLDDDVKAKLQRRAHRHGRSTEEEVCEILRGAVRDEGGTREPLGSRIAARFAGLGLTEDIPELRSEKSHEPGNDDLEPEYDFSGAVRGKHYQRYQQGTNVVLLDPDVAQAFENSESVNRALRLLLDVAKRVASQDR
jgi:antitoxin FitA